MTLYPASWLLDHDKPEFGEPCNNCGLCCRVQLCHVAMEIFRPNETERMGPCPALEMHDGKFLCGMLTRPEHYCRELSQIGTEDRKIAMAVLHQDLAIGEGCGMPDRVAVIRIEVLHE